MRLVKFAEFTKKIVGVGLNYASHIAEMKGNLGAKPTTPLIFLKPASSIIIEPQPIRIPQGCQELHHEAELGVIISGKCKDVAQSEAMNYVGGYAICLDMTARDLQQQAKKSGLPWSIAKGFDTSCPVGHFIPKEQIVDVNSLRVWCKVNGQLRQDGNTKDLLFKIPELISFISSYFTLEPGDLILSGTPSGVGAVKSGDVIEAGLGDLSSIKFKVLDKTEKEEQPKRQEAAKK